MSIKVMAPTEKKNPDFAWESHKFLPIYTFSISGELEKKYALSVQDAETPASETKKRTHWSFFNKKVL